MSKRGINGSEGNKVRLEMFSDGVFAIAITLLGLEMKIPAIGASNEHGLAHALLDQWPVYTAFIISFFIILVIWLSHNDLFRLIQSTNKPLFFANGLLLAGVTLIPFTTNLVSEYLLTTHRQIAVMVYSLVSLPVGFGYVSLLKIAITNASVRKPEADTRKLKSWLKRMMVTSLFFVASLIFAFIQPYVSLAIIFGAALYWSLIRTY